MHTIGRTKNLPLFFGYVAHQEKKKFSRELLEILAYNKKEKGSF
jgi:hypothetical protein